MEIEAVTEFDLRVQAGGITLSWRWIQSRGETMIALMLFLSLRTGEDPATGGSRMAQFRMRKLTVLVAVLLAAVAIGGYVIGTSSVSTEVRINARELEDGRTEFAIQQRDGDGWGERQLAARRYLPAEVGHNRWLNSSPYTIEITVEETEPAAETVVQFPRLDLLSQSLIDQALGGTTGTAFETRNGWWILVDLRSEQFIGDAYACNGDGLIWVGNLWTDDLAIGDTNTFRIWELSSGGMSRYHSSADTVHRQLTQLCSSRTDVDPGQEVVISVPHLHGEPAPSSTGSSPSTSPSSVTVRGSGGNAEFFTLSEGLWIASLESLEWCSMWFEGGMDLENVGGLDGSGSRDSRRVTRTGVVESDGSLSWTEPVGCEGSWTITFTPLS